MTSGNPRKIIRLAESQNWRCAYCRAAMSYPAKVRNGCAPPRDSATVDHVISKAAGGLPIWDNEVAACAWCNVHKGQYSAMAFWLLMQDMGHDHTAVARKLARMTRKQRQNLKRRAALPPIVQCCPCP